MSSFLFEVFFNGFLPICYSLFSFGFFFFVWKGDLELFPGHICVTGLVARTYGPFAPTVTPFTQTFTRMFKPTLHVFQLKPQTSHKDHVQKHD